MTAFNCVATILQAIRGNRTSEPTTSSSTTSDATLELGLEEGRMDFDCVSAFEFYSNLHQGKTVSRCEWHLNIGENDNAIKTAEKFHQDFKNPKLSQRIVDKIDTIEETFLEFHLSKTEWDKLKHYFQLAKDTECPLPIIEAYTNSQEFTSRINKDSAANTYHALKLYCTLLNCPILARTQEYTEAMTSIFFHPKLDEFLVRKKQFIVASFLMTEKGYINS
jgi:hypothetical protein